MKKRVGIICPSEIAFRRFMPALMQYEGFKFYGIAVASSEEWGEGYSDTIRANEYKKACEFIKLYGGKLFSSYSKLISSSDIDAVYLPLPPGLHYRWGKKVLESGKHLFLEKPSTTDAADTRELIQLAKEQKLALHENYMFQYHSQLEYIRNMIKSGKVGDVRLYRVSFGFPKRSQNDFRYNKTLGGGALLDCGGYTLKLASMLLGPSARIAASRLNYTNEYDIDLFGSATLENEDGLVCQVSFGMDNNYKCELEVWGSEGTIYSNRILTAPAGYEPIIAYKHGNDPAEEIKLPADDTFKKSIGFFEQCILNESIRSQNYDAIQKQADLVQSILK